MRFCLISIVLALAPLAAAGSAVSQDTVLAEQAVGNHSVEVLSDGTFKVTPNWVEAAKEGADKLATMGSDKEWFVVKDARGTMQAVYGVAPGGTLPSEVLAAMDNGYTIQKTSAPTLIGGLMPSPDDIRSALEGMLANARDAVCSMGRNKPATFGSNVSIQAGVGISGTIEFTAEWETEILCNIDG